MTAILKMAKRTCGAPCAASAVIFSEIFLFDAKSSDLAFFLPQFELQTEIKHETSWN